MEPRNHHSQPTPDSVAAYVQERVDPAAWTGQGEPVPVEMPRLALSSPFVELHGDKLVDLFPFSFILRAFPISQESIYSVDILPGCSSSRSARFQRGERLV